MNNNFLKKITPNQNFFHQDYQVASNESMASRAEVRISGFTA